MTHEVANSSEDQLFENALSGDSAGSIGIYRDCQALAAAGSAITDAGAITVKSGGFVTVSAADDTKGVRLPVPDKAGYQVIIKSTVAAKILKVWPHSGAVINALSASAALSLASGSLTVHLVWDGTTWYTLPLLPS